MLELHASLQALASRIDPFPYFPDSALEALEVDPGPPKRLDLGCVVVCPDGELYELQLLVTFGDDGSMEKRENLKEIDLPPDDYVAYAEAALTQLEAHLQA